MKVVVSRWRVLPVLLVVLLVGLLGLLSQRLGLVQAATTIHITNCRTDTQLQAAVMTHGVTTILFNCSGDILLTKTLVIDPAITTKLTMDGNDRHVTLDGHGAVQVLQVNSGVTFTLKDLTIAKGVADEGGGLFNNGTVTISESTFTHNSASSIGGGILNNGTVSIRESTFASNSAGLDGGAIFNSSGTLTIRESTFASNSAGLGGGAIFNNGTVSIRESTFAHNSTSDSSGGIFNNGTLTISNSTFASNSAISGGGGGIFNAVTGTVTISNSTFASNSSGGGGGGIFNTGRLTISNSTFASNSTSNIGGGIFNGGTLSISNSTFAHNSSSDLGGGILNGDSASISNSTFASNSASFNGGGIFNGGTLSISNSTFAHNSAPSGRGGGLDNASGTLNIGQSIVANNSGGDCLPTIPLTDEGYNLDSDGSCGFTRAKHDLPHTNPRLNPAGLANNGGPTQTIALLPSSPAIDFIPAPRVCKLHRDQRGFPRPDDDESRCDIGAYEFQDHGHEDKEG